MHREKFCNKRIVTCRFCGIEHEAGDPPENYNDRMKNFTSHESYCGSKTTPCSFCNTTVKLKDIEYHIQLFHSGKEKMNENYEWTCQNCSELNSDLNVICKNCGYDKVNNVLTRKPEAIHRINELYCGNIPCREYISKLGDAHKKYLCSKCYENIIFPNDTEEDLEKFLYEKYNRQLTYGCGNDKCTNYFCKNGIKNYNSNNQSPRETTISTNNPYSTTIPLPESENDIILLITNMIDYTLKNDPPLYAICLPIEKDINKPLFSTKPLVKKTLTIQQQRLEEKKRKNRLISTFF